LRKLSAALRLAFDRMLVGAAGAVFSSAPFCSILAVSNAKETKRGPAVAPKVSPRFESLSFREEGYFS
jgi:hypothetical protein